MTNKKTKKVTSMTNNNKTTKVNSTASKLLLLLSTAATISTFSYSSAVLAAVNPANLVQAGYWYSDEDVRAVLKNRLDQANSYVAPALPFESEVLLTDVVRDSINEARNKGTALIPVNFANSHWAALAIKRTNAGALKVIHNDSFGSPIDSKANSRLLRDIIRQIDPTIEIVDLQVRQQSDGSSCGAFTAENLIKIAELDVSNLSNDQLKELLTAVNDATSIRNSHFYILYEGEGVFDIEELKPKAQVIGNELENQNRQLLQGIANVNSFIYDRLSNLNRSFAGVASGDNNLSAPRKVRKNQSVRIRPMQSLTSSIEPTIALQEVTNVMKPVEGTYQAATQVKVLSPVNI